VTTGQVVDELVELTSGVRAGDRVILDQGPQLVDGVRITPSDAPATAAAPAKQ